MKVSGGNSDGPGGSHKEELARVLSETAVTDSALDSAGGETSGGRGSFDLR